jgi:hypothetical protein
LHSFPLAARRKNRASRFPDGVRLLVERGEFRPVLRDEHGKQPCRSVALAFSLTEWAAPGGSSQLSPAS